MSKVKIQLSPYSALSILAFLREYINDEIGHDYQFEAIKSAVDEYEDQIGTNITEKQITECQQENQINQLIGKSPQR